MEPGSPLRRPNVVTRLRLAALVSLLLATTGGCAGRTGQAAGAPTPPPTRSSPAPGNLVPDGYAGRFRVTATVLENREHGPQLCLAVLSSTATGLQRARHRRLDVEHGEA